MLCSLSDAFGFNSESFEYGASDQWEIPDVADSAGMSDPLDVDFLGMLDGADMPISMDFLSESRNGNGQSFHDDGLKLALGKDNKLTVLGELSAIRNPVVFPRSPGMRLPGLTVFWTLDSPMQT